LVIVALWHWETLNGHGRTIQINYQGASGDVDVDANGDVIGTYDVWTVGDDGKIKVIDRKDGTQAPSF